MDTLTEYQLVLRAREGNRSAFAELVRRHQRGVLSLGLRLTKDIQLAEELVRETFLRAHKELERCEGVFRNWLYRIAIQTARRIVRRTRPAKAAVARRPEETLHREQIGEVLQAEIARLPFRQRTALTLRIYGGMPFREISTIMLCPYDTAKANYRHALVKLREIFTTLAQGQPEVQV